MTTLIIGLLVALCCYLGMRLFAFAHEITTLRAHVALLKRQLHGR